MELNGGDIESKASDTDADLSHTGLKHNAEHKVDWRTPTPTVTGVEVTSNAGSDDTYILGDVITVSVTFSEAVNVDTSGGTPSLNIDMDPIDMDPAEWGTKAAAYQGGSGTTTLTFTHTVVEPNKSTQGIAVLANSLDLNGGTIKSVSSDTNADLSHRGLPHDSAHKVDWQQSASGSAEPTPTPTAAPTPEPTPEPTEEPTATPTPEATPEPTATPTPEATPEPTATPTPEATPEPTATPTPEPTPTATPTPEATPEPTATPTPEATPEPTATPTPEPTPTATPTPEATPEPTATPTPEPTPTATPTPEATPEPTATPTPEPTPTATPTPEATPEPTATPTPEPTPEPTPTPVPQKSVPGTPANLQVSSTPGSLALSATWDALDGATSYRLAWRQADGAFEAVNAATVNRASATFTVSGYGQWVVQLEGCNDAVCGSAVTSQVDVAAPPATGPLHVAVAASPSIPAVNQTTHLNAVISNPPEGESPSYSWEVETGGGEWSSFGKQATWSFMAAKVESWSFRVTVSYGNGDSATSDPLTLTWVNPNNRAPVVDTEGENYAQFVGDINAPSGVLVSKPLYQVFSDPDGDKLSYAATITSGNSHLVEELDLRLPDDPNRPAITSVGIFPRLFLTAGDDADWKAISPALADPARVTVRVTATDTSGLSASVEGDYLVQWDSYPEVVSAEASGKAIEVTFDVAVEDDPASPPASSR